MKKGTKNYLSWNNRYGHFQAKNEGNVVLAIYENKQGNKHTHRLNFENEEQARSFTIKFNRIMSLVSSHGSKIQLPTTCSIYNCWVQINFDPNAEDESNAIRFTFGTPKETRRFLIHYSAAILKKSVNWF